MYYSNSQQCSTLNSSFTSNNATYGGAISVEATDSSEIFNSSFSNNTASVFGGAIYVPISSSLREVSHSSFIGNSAQYSGGAIHVDSPINVNIIYSSFIGNRVNTGDGGAVFTNNEEYANKIKLLRVHGQNKRYHHKYIGIGGRLDTMQAAILLAKLPYFKKELKDRQKVADHYTNSLSKILQTPVIKPNRSSAWAQYTLRVKNRDALQLKLKKNDVLS
jgi:predicted outer membrane repeat protein